MSKLQEWLKEMMPKHMDQGVNSGKMLVFRVSPIRRYASSFAYAVPSLPTTGEELQNILWVFGERIAGDMERRMNYALKLAEDAQSLSLKPIIMNRPQRMSDMEQYEEDNGKIGPQCDQ